MPIFLPLSMYHNGQSMLISLNEIVSINPGEVRPGAHPVRTVICLTDGSHHEVRDTVEEVWNRIRNAADDADAR